MSWLVNPYMLGAPIEAYGGYVSYYTSGADTYAVHKFTDTGSNTFKVVKGTGEIDYLVVGGGGGGGCGPANTSGRGGGGGGGVVSGTTSVSVNDYSIFVGAGGNMKNQSANGNNGQNSTAFSITAIGGGGGGTFDNAGLTGASGGGGGAGATTAPAGGSATQGYAGGSGSNSNNVGGQDNGGGGGGAASVGTDASTTVAGDGGNGIQSSITGTSTYYGGGGGGGNGGTTTAGGNGGLGGGGAGGQTGVAPVAGTPNTGGGGGGSGNVTGVSVANVAPGGTGIVVVRYKINQIPNTYVSAYGGNSVSYKIDENNYPYFVHQYTSTGSSTFVVSSGNGYVNYLIVGGGGQGGSTIGGGGGAGGMISGILEVSPQSYSVSVGAGGTGGPAGEGSGGDGGSSSFASITALGGVGGNKDNTFTGGSGGGGGRNSGTASLGTDGQGYDGSAGAANDNVAGAGGGKGTAGQFSGPTRGGCGGLGGISTIMGSPLYYAGGGGAGARTGSVPGPAIYGGGGSGSNGGNGTAGTPNTGGGGGGAGYNGTYYAGGVGGSGIVIVRYPAQSFGIVTNDLLYFHSAGMVQSYSGTGTTVNNIATGTGNATLTNGATYSSSNGGIFDLDGTDDHIAIPEIDLRRNFSLEAWASPDALANFWLFGQGTNATNSGLHCGIRNDGVTLRFGLFFNDYDASPAPTFTLGNWYHFVFTYNHSTFAKKIYLNGSELPGTNVSGPAAYAGTGQINNGRTYSAGTAYSNGRYGETRIYGIVLSAAEIAQNFNATKSRYGL